MSNPQFSFQDDSPVASRKHRRQAGSGASSAGGATTDTDNGSVAGSLTYSATSSVQSGGSAAGESTDSSFADILRAIDNNDAESAELTALAAKVGVGGAAGTGGPPVQIEARRQSRSSHKPGGAGGASSGLQHSGRGESSAVRVALTTTGQPSDSSAPDLGGLGVGAGSRPRAGGGAARQSSGRGVESSSASVALGHAHGAGQQPQHRGGAPPQRFPQHRPRQHHRSKSDSSIGSTGSGRSRDSAAPASPHSQSRHVRKSRTAVSPPQTHRRLGSAGAAPTSSSVSSATTGTPPTSPPPRAKRKDEIQDARKTGEAWYSQWWMCGFSDALTGFGIDP